MHKSFDLPALILLVGCVVLLGMIAKETAVAVAHAEIQSKWAEAQSHQLDAISKQLELLTLRAESVQERGKVR